jgi:hypothetical protein
MANAYLNLGQDNPGAVLTDLYTVPASTEAIGTLFVGNIASVAKTFRMAFSIAGAGIANDHYLYFDLAVPANDTFLVTGIAMAATDVLRVFGSDDNVTFNFVGVEITA